LTISSKNIIWSTLHSLYLKWYCSFHSEYKIPIQIIMQNQWNHQLSNLRDRQKNDLIGYFFRLELKWSMTRYADTQLTPFVDKCWCCFSHQSRDRLSTLVAEHLDHLHYVNDILMINIDTLNDVLTDQLLNRLLIPLYVYSLTKRRRHDLTQVTVSLHRCMCTPWPSDRDMTSHR